jgi:hypothetical protein
MRRHATKTCEFQGGVFIADDSLDHGIAPRRVQTRTSAHPDCPQNAPQACQSPVTTDADLAAVVEA